MSVLSLIKRPLVSEKSNRLAENNTYVFQVELSATKPLIKKALEIGLRVKVKKVRTLVARKQHKKNRFGGKKVKYWKKAFVTLKQGEKMPLFEKT